MKINASLPILFLALISLAIMPSVMALPDGTNLTSMNCQSDSDYFYVSPMLFQESKVYWVCRLNTTANYTCWSHIWTDDKSQMLQTNPEREKIDQVGIIDYFSSQNGLVNVYFTTKNIKMDQNFTFEVECIDSGDNWGNFERNVTVELSSSEVYNIAPFMVWAKNNATWILGVVIISFIILFIIVTEIKRH